MGLMMLSAATGTEITVEASGKQAADVMDAITKLVTGGFGKRIEPFSFSCGRGGKRKPGR